MTGMRQFKYGYMMGSATAISGVVVFACIRAFFPGFTPNYQLVMNAIDWLIHNLGWSILPFILCLMLFGLYLSRLKQTLRATQDAEPELAKVTQLEHMCDVWVGLFFGIGVIWTAIGMRGALIHTLAEPSQTLDADPAMMLSRLVDGGILVALSTTIVGGIGGYLMRIVKSSMVGGELREYYVRHVERHQLQANESLASIKHSLSSRRRIASSDPNFEEVE